MRGYREILTIINSDEWKKKAYLVLRIIHLITTAAMIPVAQVYANRQGLKIMGGAFGSVATIYAIAVLLYFEQYFYPLKLAEAIFMTGTLLLTLIAGMFSSGGNFLFSSYMTFFNITAIQSFLVICFAIMLLFSKFIRFPFIEKTSFKDSILFSSMVLLIGSPLISGTIMYAKPVMDQLFSVQQNWQRNITLAAMMTQVFMSAVRILWLPFKASRNDNFYSERSRVLKEWAPGINIVFFVTMITCMGIDIFG